MLIYAKLTDEPAAHTILNFPVNDIEAVVDRLSQARVKFEHSDGPVIRTNENGIAMPPSGRGP